MKAPAKLDRAELSICKINYRIKHPIKAIKKIEYIADRSHEGYRTEDALCFNKTEDRISYEKFIESLGLKENFKRNNKFPLVYELILSVPDEYYQGETHYQSAIRKVMENFGKKKGLKIEWIGAVHDPIKKSHVHLMVNPKARLENPRKDEHKERYVTFKKDDILWIRNELKRQMGMKWVKTNYFENELRITEKCRQNSREWKEFSAFIEQQKKINRTKRTTYRVAILIEGKEEHSRGENRFWGLFGGDRKKERDERGLFDR